jgi:putative membrane protein
MIRNILKKIFLFSISGIIGIYLSARFIEGVKFSGQIESLIAIGIVLGIINSIIKPIIDKITLPFKILTFGLSSLLINMFFIWVVKKIFSEELIIKGIYALFLTTIIIVILNYIVGLYPLKKYRGIF